MYYCVTPESNLQKIRREMQARKQKSAEEENTK